ncbi:MAG: SpaA isopeptide-forming pilin-related protein, partial [Methanocorpusculum sp.]|nr:SpaA isopeptide-forming pilin-related protein [Methanocorpusculum sp.]
MKTMKKVIALLLVAVMAIGLMATTAFAANDGTITVRNATVGEEYAVYKIFDLTYGTPLTGASGQKTPVAYSYTKTGANDALYTALTAADSPFTLTATSTPNVYNVSSTADAATISSFLTGLTEYGKTETDAGTNLLAGCKVGDTKTAAANTVTFEDLPYGYYYVTSSLGSVVTIDSTLKNVTVVDKNQGPSWDNNPEDPDDPTPPDGNTNPGKVIVDDEGNKSTVNSVNYGDTVHFNISVNATAYDGTGLVTYYYITDTLADGFGAAQDIVVKVYPIDPATGKYSTTAQTLTADEYTLAQDDNSFQVTVPFGEKYGSRAKIEVTYSAVVNADGEDVVIAGAGNPNTANFTYTTVPTDPDDPNDPHKPGDPNYPDPEDPNDPDSPNPYNETNEKTTKTYVYALGIKKVDPKGNILKGAEFSVKNGNTAITAVATGTAGVYKYSATGTVTQFSTDDNGILIIQGLEAGTYTVKEEVAPLGYNLLTGTIDVTAAIASTSSYTTTITTYYDADGNVTAQDVNNTDQTTTTVTAPVNVVP